MLLNASAFQLSRILWNLCHPKSSSELVYPEWMNKLCLSSTAFAITQSLFRSCEVWFLGVGPSIAHFPGTLPTQNLLLGDGQGQQEARERDAVVSTLTAQIWAGVTRTESRRPPLFHRKCDLPFLTIDHSLPMGGYLVYKFVVLTPILGTFVQVDLHLCYVYLTS